MSNQETRSVEVLLDSIEQLQEKENHHRRHADEFLDIKKRDIAALQKKLVAGATTGDRLKDAVIRAHGFDKLAELMGQYRELERQLAGKRGEFILLPYTAEMRGRHTMTGVETWPIPMFRLGVLTGEEVVWKEGKGLFSRGQIVISLPVDRFIMKEVELCMPDKPLARALEIQEGDLFTYTSRDDSPDFHGLAHYMHSITIGGDSHTLIIGDEAVKAWLKEHGMPGFYKPAADALSKLILEPTEGESS